MKTISIITVVRNGAETIRDCIESVRLQHHPAEHIVIDGCSTDGTLEILESCRQYLARIVSEPDRGIYDAMNKGIALVTGDVIGILNADDHFAGPEVLSRVAGIFADETVESCYGDLVYVKDAGAGATAHGITPFALPFRVVRYWRSGSYDPQRFYRGWMPPHPTFFVRKRAYDAYGLFNPALGSAADYELMLRFLVKHGITSVHIPEVLVRMRSGGMSNASLGNRLRAHRMDRMAWQVNGLKPFPWTLALKPLSKLIQYVRTP